MSKVPLPPTMTAEEKAKHILEVEKAKAALRVEETFPEADQCAACNGERARTGDPTFLCEEHLRRIYGV
jgi:hypothetical protein